MSYRGFGASRPSEDPLLQWLSTTVYVYRALASAKCPALVSNYDFLVNAIAAVMTSTDSSSAAEHAEDLAEELAYLNNQCGISGAATGLPAAPKAAPKAAAKKTTTAVAKPAAPAASVSVAPVGPDPLTSGGSSWTFAPTAPAASAAASGGSGALLLGAAALVLYLLWS
jgi:hypothetical protein